MNTVWVEVKKRENCCNRLYTNLIEVVAVASLIIIIVIEIHICSSQSLTFSSYQVARLYLQPHAPKQTLLFSQRQVQTASVIFGIVGRLVLTSFMLGSVCLTERKSIRTACSSTQSFNLAYYPQNRFVHPGNCVDTLQARFSAACLTRILKFWKRLIVCTNGAPALPIADSLDDGSRCKSTPSSRWETSGI
jgi:hypothetical protein